MKIYTKTGDSGQTSLIGGRRVSKAALRIDAYGTVDELNAHIGLVRDQPVNDSRKDLLKEIQDRLFTIGAELAADPEKAIKRPLPAIIESDVIGLEDAMDEMDAQLPECGRLFYRVAIRPSRSLIWPARSAAGPNGWSLPCTKRLPWTRW